MTTKEAVRSFYLYRCQNGRAETAKVYRNLLEDLPWQEEKIQAITFPMIMRVLEPSAKLSASTRNLRRTILRTFFQYLANSDLIPKDPTRLLKSERAPIPESRYLSPKDAAKLLRAVKGSSHELLITLALMTGMRRHEVLNLTVGQVRGKKAITIVGKGQKSRIVYLHTTPTHLVKKACDGRADEEPLFVSYRGTRLSPSGMAGLLNRYLAKAGVKGRYSPHNLRATFASACYAKTKDLRTVQELLGHSSPTTTAHYVNVSADVKMNAVRNLYS